MAAANIQGERREIQENPEEEKEELSLFYLFRGLKKTEADAVAEKLSHSPEEMLQALTAEELGGVRGGNRSRRRSPRPQHRGRSVHPRGAVFWLGGTQAVVWAAIISLIAHFLVGAAKSLFTLRSWWASGPEMTVADVIVGGATYLLGLLFKVHKMPRRSAADSPAEIHPSQAGHGPFQPLKG